jgi:hypothetical protein
MSQEKIKNRIDYDTLSETLSIQTKYGEDEAMLVYIRSKLEELDVTVQEDTYGNIYVTKGEAEVYPCIVAHVDTVQNVIPNVSLFRLEDTIFAFDPTKRAQHGIGGDDKVGVYITLQALVDIPILKAVFYRDEEIGCLGSSYSIKHHKDWYADCGYVLMADRKGNSDVIYISGGIRVTSEEFLDGCTEFFSKYSYKEAIGIYTDIDTLSRGGIGVSTVNLSCGYHNPHTSTETVSINDVNKCYNLIYDILTKYSDKRFKHELQFAYPKHSKSSGNARNSHINELLKYASPISVPIKSRQERLYSPLVLGINVNKYDNFIETDITKNKKRVHKYTGTKSLPITGEVKCPRCAAPAFSNVYFLPYESRMYCIVCNDYVDDEKTGELLHYLDVEDKEESFVFSVYASGWIKRDHAVWNEKLSSWVPDELPF